MRPTVDWEDFIEATLCIVLVVLGVLFVLGAALLVLRAIF